jgi:hypothetical protein
MVNRWASGRCTAAYSNLLDYPWLQAKLNTSGTADLERVFDHGSNQAGLKRSHRVLSKASHFLAAQPEQLSSQHLARWPTDPRAGPPSLPASSLRDQAITQLQKAGASQPLTASLMASEALLHPLPIRVSTLNALAVLPGEQLTSGPGITTSNSGTQPPPNPNPASRNS